MAWASDWIRQPQLDLAPTVIIGTCSASFRRAAWPRHTRGAPPASRAPPPGCPAPAPVARAGRPPFADAALALLEAMPRAGQLIFEGARAGRPISDMSMTMVLRRMGHDNIMVHGFRSAAKDWASEMTSHADIVSKMALAHTISVKVQAAYRRGDLLKKRRKLMADWAKYWGVKLPPRRVSGYLYAMPTDTAMPPPRRLCRYCFAPLRSDADGDYCGEDCEDGQWRILPTIDGSV
jgi:hypothetical protein